MRYVYFQNDTAKSTCTNIFLLSTGVLSNGPKCRLENLKKNPLYAVRDPNNKSTVECYCFIYDMSKYIEKEKAEWNSERRCILIQEMLDQVRAGSNRNLNGNYLTPKNDSV